MSDNTYRQMLDTELLSEYDKSLQEYKKWIDKKLELNEGWQDEIEYLAFTRGDLHEQVNELQKKKTGIQC